jgi:hypothetical protein
MKKIAAALCLLTSSLSFARLPPLFESQGLIKRILDSAEVRTKLTSAAYLKGIIRSDKFDGFEILYSRGKKQCKLEVGTTIKFQPGGRMGPALFDLDFSREAVCVEEVEEAHTGL